MACVRSTSLSTQCEFAHRYLCRVKLLLSLEKQQNTIMKIIKRPRLRPAGSDPGVVCQKNSFLKVSVSLGGFGPSVAHGKHSVRRRCVQRYEKQGRNLLSPWRHWAPFVRPLKGLDKNRRLGKPQACTLRLKTGLVCTVRYALSLKRSLSLPARTSECLWEVVGTLTLSFFCMHRSGCSYCDASGEFCLPSLRVLSFSA